MVKVGDEVRMKIRIGNDCDYLSNNKTAIITKIQSRPDGTLEFWFINSPNDTPCGPHINQENKIELIKRKQGLMKNLGIMLKKLVDADTQTLLKAEYLNGDLELTDAGERALLAILFSANKAELVALAQAELDEAAKKE